MPELCSFLQNAILSLRSLFVRAAKRDYRGKAVLLSAGLVFAVAAFTSSGFGGGGKSALTVFAETSCLNEGSAEETEEQGGLPGDEAGSTGSTDSLKISKDTYDEGVTEAQQEKAGSPGTGAERRSGEAQREEDAERRTEEAQREEEEEPRGNEAQLEAEAQSRPDEAQLEAETQSRLEEAQRRIEEAQREAEEAHRKEEEAARTATAVPMTQEDYRVLCRIVQAEAGICDDKGRILVANVIFNRVRSEEFPDTVTAVVYQKSQFSPVRDGSIDTCVVTQETIDCVDRAISGEDYSQGALFFMNRGGSSARNRNWFDSHLTYLFSHDRHEFYK